MILKLKTNKFKNQRGFTVLESLVAILILSISIAVAFAAVQQSLAQNSQAMNEIKAFYLAQEAVEIIRNKRDANQLARINGDVSVTSWLSGISESSADPCYFGTGPNDVKVCMVDAYTSLPSMGYCGSSSFGNCPLLKQEIGLNIFNQLTGNNTIFRREIKLERVQNDSFGKPIEVAVIVRISWTRGLITRSFEAKTYLFNWAGI